MENILLSAAKGELASCDNMVRDVVRHFNGDLEQSDLMRELALLKNEITGCEIIYDTLRANVSEYRCVFPQVLKLLRLLFVIPATSATSEQSFSVLRLVKTHLRCTMKQERLNHLKILRIHRDRKVNLMKAISKLSPKTVNVLKYLVHDKFILLSAQAQCVWLYCPIHMSFQFHCAYYYYMFGLPHHFSKPSATPEQH